MNRYVRTGLHIDLLDGKRVLYLGPTRHEGRYVLDEMAAEMDLTETRVVRVNGAERIEHRSGGWVRFSSIGSSLRGYNVDVVVVDGDLSDSATEDIRVMTAAGAELVRL